MRAPLRLAPLAAFLVVLSGCFSENLVTVQEIDGSNDHRVFRIASVTKLMMEPVLWQLEDAEKINFDNPVSLYLKNRLPPEFDKVTLRMLRDNTSGLPREFIDPWCLGDVYSAFKCGLVGSNLYDGFDRRGDFIRRLWDPRIRGDVRRREPRYSSVGFALMMMAICDELRTTPEELCRRYLVKPYGLQDTSFIVTEALRPRLTPACAGHLPWLRPAGWEVPDHRDGEVTMLAGGMLSSASDILRVCRVILPHLDRAKGLLERRTLSDGRTIYYRTGMIYGGHAFVGLDPVDSRAVVILKNETCWTSDDGFELMESLIPPRTTL